MKLPEPIRRLKMRCQRVLSDDNSITRTHLFPADAAGLLDALGKLIRPRITVHILPMRYEQPRCPLCGGRMVAAKVDRVGTDLYVWLCDCDDDSRDVSTQESEETEVEDALELAG